MLLFPLHGTLDLHDGVGVLIVAATLAIATALSALRERLGRGGAGATPRRSAPASEEGTDRAGALSPDRWSGDAARTRRDAPGEDRLGAIEGEARS